MSAVSARGAIWNVCIDFGTAFSKAAAAPVDAWSAFDPGHVRPLTVGAVAPGANPFLLESAVFVGDTHIAFGAEAIREAGLHAASKRQALRSFKTLLSVPDLDRALDTQLPRSIDPHRLFRQRDLIVLFLAYLMRAIDTALKADPVLARAEIKRRYALPAWTGGKAMHGRISGLFAAAEQVSAQLGDALFDPAGITIAKASAALKSVEGAPELSLGMIFEATAAASYCLIGLDAPASHLMVVDMGAGTTDFAALAKRDDRFDDIVDARATLMEAGDLVDRILLDLILSKALGIKGRANQAELWRGLMGSIREVKETLFLDGRYALTYRGESIVITMRDLSKDADFKAFVKQLKKALEASLNALAARAAMDKVKTVSVVAVGGGAEAPFIKELVRAAKAPRVRVNAYPATPSWAHAAVFGGNLAPIFPQLAIAIGGALAPDALLAAR